VAFSIIDELLDRVVTHTSFLLNLEDLSFPSSGIHAHHFNADPDLDPSRFTLMRIRIQLLFNVIGSCNHWFIAPPGLHFELQGLHCECPRPTTAIFSASKALNFGLNADLDPGSIYSL
jgi:hypothetical protein